MMASVFSIIELGVCTINLPPQQANTQWMRLKMCSNPKVYEGGQHPITNDRHDGSKPNDFTSLGVYRYSWIWVRVGTRKWNNSSHSSSVNPSWSALKNTTSSPQFTFEKTSEWRSFSFSRLEPGKYLTFRQALHYTWRHFQCFGLCAVQRKLDSKQREIKPHLD